MKDSLRLATIVSARPGGPARAGFPVRVLAVLALSCLPAACGGLSNPFEESFRPLNNEIAVQAMPQPPAPDTPAEKGLYCRIGNGSARFSGGWYDFAETGFTLSPGARVNVPLSRNEGDGNITIQGIFDTNGQKLIFCPVVDGPPDKRVACGSLYALEDDLNTGIKRSFDIPNAIRGADISCAYNAKNLQKL